jgi:hypothetical protein
VVVKVKFRAFRRMLFIKWIELELKGQVCLISNIRKIFFTAMAC